MGHRGLRLRPGYAERGPPPASQFSEETRAGAVPRAGQSRGVSPVQPGTRAVVAELLWSSRGVGTEIWHCQVWSPVSASSREGLDVTVPALWHLVTGAQQARGFSEQVSEQFLSCVWCSVIQFLSFSFQLNPLFYRDLIFK